MTDIDPRIADALTAEVPVRDELRPAWSDVLARVAGRSRGPRRLLAPRLSLVAAVVVAAGLAVAGLAVADAFGPLHGAKLVVDPATIGGASGISTCDLIGRSADQVGARLTSSGIGVEWRFMHWGSTVAATGQGSVGAVTGGTSDAVSSVPGDSVVWDVVPDGQTKAFVFVQAPNDPNALTISTGNCSG